MKTLAINKNKILKQNMCSGVSNFDELMISKLSADEQDKVSTAISTSSLCVVERNYQYISINIWYIEDKNSK